MPSFLIRNSTLSTPSLPSIANRTYLPPSSSSNESSWRASGHARSVAWVICAMASSRFFTGAVHAVANCDGAPPMDDVVTQLYVAGHLRRRFPVGSRPVGSPVSSPTMLASAGRAASIAASAPTETVLLFITFRSSPSSWREEEEEDAQHRGGGWMAARRLEVPGAVLLPARFKYPRCRTTSGASSWAGPRSIGLGYVR